MGSNQSSILKIENDLPNIFWYDENLYTDDNQGNLSLFKQELMTYNFFEFNSIEILFQVFEYNLEKLSFNLFYVIVSGSSSDKFYVEYTKFAKKFGILACTIVYCINVDKYKNKPYFLDTYLNPGKVNFSPQAIINFIKTDQIGFKLLDKDPPEQFYSPVEANFGDSFSIGNSISDICYPILLSQIIDRTLIDEKELKDFQNFLLKYYPWHKKLIKPSKDKDIEVPLDITAKYLIKLYTEENPDRYENTLPFYKNLNIDLTNENYNIYIPYVVLFYDYIKNHPEYSYSGKLYRGSLLSKKEFGKIQKYIEDKRNGKYKGKESTGFYYSKSFLSFSKDEEITNRDFIKKPNNPNLISAKFIINELNQNEKGKENLFTQNLDMEKFSKYDEKENLFPPFSCFEIVDLGDEIVTNGKNERVPTKIIYLDYLNKYTRDLEKKLKRISKKENADEKMKSFIKDCIGTPFAIKVNQLMNNKLNNSFYKCFGFNPMQNLPNSSMNFLNYLYSKNHKQPSLNNNIVLKNIDIRESEAFNQFMSKKTVWYKKVYCDIFGGDCILCKLEDNTEVLLSEGRRGKVEILSQKTSQEGTGFSENNITDSSEGYQRCSKNLQEICDTMSETQKKSGFFTSKSEKIDKTISSCNDEFSKFKANPLVPVLCAAGSGAGQLLANLDSFINQPSSEKFKTLTLIFLPAGVEALHYLPLEKVCSLIPGFYKITPYFGFPANAAELAQCFWRMYNNNSLTKKEKFYDFLRLVGSTGSSFLLNLAVSNLIFKGAKFLCSVSHVGGPGAILFSFTLSIVSGYVVRKINNYIQDKTFTLKSDCLYSGYIPEKYRNKINPNFIWSGVSGTQKSFVLELIEDDYKRKWLVLNIPALCREIQENNKTIGDTIISYQGVSHFSNKVKFILYEIKVDTKLKEKDWIENQEKEKLVSNIVTLEVY